MKRKRRLLARALRAFAGRLRDWNRPPLHTVKLFAIPEGLGI